MVGIYSHPVFALSKRISFWALAIALSAAPIRAQKGGSSGGSSGGSRGAPTGGFPAGGTTGRPIYSTTDPGSIPNEQPGIFTPTTATLQKSVVNEDESCLPWDVRDVRGS